jgi:hypothetical protein
MYAKTAATSLTPTPTPPIPSSIDIKSINEKLSQQLSDTFGPQLDITMLEQQVQQTSTDIEVIKVTLED